MMYYTRPSLLDRIFAGFKALSALILCLVIFMAGVTLENYKENEAREELRVFLEDLNAGLYDHRYNSIPEKFRMYMVEPCYNGGYYVSGKVYAFSFQGYTFPNNLMGEMNWNFSGHVNGPLEFWLKAFGLAGSVTSAFWLVGSRIFGFRLKDLFESEDDYAY